MRSALSARRSSLACCHAPGLQALPLLLRSMDGRPPLHVYTRKFKAGPNRDNFVVAQLVWTLAALLAEVRACVHACVRAAAAAAASRACARGGHVACWVHRQPILHLAEQLVQLA